MFSLYALVLVLVAFGYGLRKRGLVRPEAALDLNQLVFTVALPPLIFLALHRATLSWSLMAMPAVAWTLSLVWIALGVAFAKLRRLPKGVAGSMILAMTFANTTFFGYPIISGLYGEKHLTLAIFYDLLGATLATNTLGVAVASAYGEGEGSWRHILKKLATFPPIWAMGLGLALHGVALPGVVEGVLQRLADLTVPLIMLSFGMTLRFSAWRNELGTVACVAVARLAIFPLIAWGLVQALGLPSAFKQAAVMEAAMPTMFYAFTLALSFGLNVELTVNAIMVTSLLSFLTLPVWYRLLGG